MVYFFRALGWLLFGSGALIFIATGGFGGIKQGSVITMVGGVLMPVGMFVTAMCTAIANWRIMHARPRREEPQEQAAPPPEKPAAPEKQYRVRPLKNEGLPPSDPGQAE